MLFKFFLLKYKINTFLFKYISTPLLTIIYRKTKNPQIFNALITSTQMKFLMLHEMVEKQILKSQKKIESHRKLSQKYNLSEDSFYLQEMKKNINDYTNMKKDLEHEIKKSNEYRIN